MVRSDLGAEFVSQPPRGRHPRRYPAREQCDRADLARLLDRSVADGRSAVTTGKTDCRIADRQVAGLEQSLGVSSTPPPSPSLTDAIAPSAANAAIAPTQPLPPGNVHGVTDHEIRFGIVIPFSGGAKDNGKNIKLGTDVAFARVNDAGGV